MLFATHIFKWNRKRITICHKENDICLVSLNEEVDTDEILEMTCMKKTRRVFGDLIGTKGKTFWQYAKFFYKYI